LLGKKLNEATRMKEGKISHKNSKKKSHFNIPMKQREKGKWRLRPTKYYGGGYMISRTMNITICPWQAGGDQHP